MYFAFVKRGSSVIILLLLLLLLLFYVLNSIYSNVVAFVCSNIFIYLKGFHGKFTYTTCIDFIILWFLYFCFIFQLFIKHKYNFFYFFDVRILFTTAIKMPIYQGLQQHIVANVICKQVLSHTLYLTESLTFLERFRENIFKPFLLFVIQSVDIFCLKIPTITNNNVHFYSKFVLRISIKCFICVC